MCPVCPDARGVPISVKNEADGQTVEFRCPDCEHVWLVEGMETLSERFRKLLAGEIV